MKKFLSFLLLTSSLCIGLINIAYSETNTSTVGMAMCDRIEKQGVCEEYRLSTLTSDDKSIIIKHCTSDALCPDQNRIGRCLKNKDPDGVIFNKHYYRNVADKDDWKVDFIEKACGNNDGNFEAN